MSDGTYVTTNKFDFEKEPTFRDANSVILVPLMRDDGGICTLYVPFKSRGSRHSLAAKERIKNTVY
jgi:hypothetical protein